LLAGEAAVEDRQPFFGRDDGAVVVHYIGPTTSFRWRRLAGGRDQQLGGDVPN